MMACIKLHNLRLNNINKIYNLSEKLARYFPYPDHCITGIYELLLNAVEHGNLGLGFETKTALIRAGTWYEEVRQRLTLPEYDSKKIHITLTHDARECRLTISDQGDGFAWKKFTNYIAEDRRPNGRGLQIAYNSQFDDITFNAIGNEVTCVAQYVRHQ